MTASEREKGQPPLDGLYVARDGYLGPLLILDDMVERAAEALMKQGHYYGYQDEQRQDALRDARDVLAAAMRPGE